MLKLDSNNPVQKVQHISEVITDIENDERSLLDNDFVTTGFNKLNNILNGGFYKKQLVVIGARPSVGKTSIAQQMILKASDSGKKCLFISLEVDKKNVFLKFVSNMVSIDGYKLQIRKFNQSELESIKQAKKNLRELNIYVNDSSSLNVSQIENIIKKQLEIEPVDMVFIDYIQIIRFLNQGNFNEASAIKENTSRLKEIAKKYNVGVVALAQISRKGVENNQEPTVNDLKGSGGIEEDADVAILLHRDKNQEEGGGYFSNNGKLIIAKNRHGATGVVGFEFEGKFSRFTESVNNF
jgi:replicative DNA helicase